MSSVLLGGVPGLLFVIAKAMRPLSSFVGTEAMYELDKGEPTPHPGVVEMLLTHLFGCQSSLAACMVAAKAIFMFNKLWKPKRP